MDADNIIKTGHLFLGLSKQELARRLSSGQIDLQILKAQIEQNSRETQLDPICEDLIEHNLLEQMDKFTTD